MYDTASVPTPTPTPKRTRKRRTNAERMPEVLGTMSPDAIYKLGKALGIAYPMSADLFVKGIDEGRAPEIRDPAAER